MKPQVLIASLAATLSLLVSCTSTAIPLATSAEERGRATRCKIEGTMNITNDGHAYIGQLVLSGGKCVDVSLPQSQVRKLLGQPPRKQTVNGRVLPYVYHGDLDEIRVNGRLIGYGSCGDFYVFVK